MSSTLKSLGVTLSAAALSLTGCGGGGGGGSSGGASPSAPSAPVVQECVLSITNPESGSVTSSAGGLDCSEGSICEFTIGSERFQEVFTARPSNGFTFQRWEDSPDSVCSGDSEVCEVDIDIPSQSNGPCAPDGDGKRKASLTPIFASDTTEPTTKPTFTVSGLINVLENAHIDSDTNNPDNGYQENNRIETAQPIGNPSIVGGYLNDVATGEDGNTYDSGDDDDFFSLNAMGGEVISLFTAKPDEGDLDLYLFNNDGDIVEFSAGTGALEQITIPAAGTWYLNPYLYSGASSYALTIGVGSASARSDVIPNEVVIEYAGETVLLPEASATRRRKVQEQFALEERGGGLARARRMQLRSGAPNTADILPTRLQPKALRLAQDNELRQRWQTEMMAKTVAQQPGVYIASPNYRVRAHATTNDTFFPYLWHYSLINVPAAWDITTGNSDVVVAVIDSGVVVEHPDIAGQLLPGFDFIADADAAGDGDGLDPNPTDEGEGSTALRSGSFHGLHVAGTISAVGNNNRGIAGIAYGSRVMPLRVLGADGAGNSYDVLQAIRYAAGLSNDSGTVPNETADVINLSLGGGGYSQIEQNLFAALADRGILVAAASGNAGTEGVEYPAAYDYVFAVGATDGQGNATSYSNRGSALDLVAPGGEMEADSNGDGQPDGILSTYYSEGLPEYAFLQGTSMATPHAAGVFALMKSVYPDLNEQNLARLLQAGALTSDLGEQGRDDVYGWGLIDARKAVSTALDAAGGVSNLPPKLGISSTNLNLGNILSNVEIILSNLGDGDIRVASVQSSANWLSANPLNTNDDGLGTWRITADRTSLDPGSYDGTLTFKSSAGDAMVRVSLRSGDGSNGDIGTVYILFIDHDTQEVIDQAVTRADQNYQFARPNLPEGDYEIWAGTDNDNDFFICDDGETCGAYQTMDEPIVLEVRQDQTGINFSSDYQISLRTASNNLNASASTAAQNPPKTGLRRIQRPQQRD